MFNYNRLHLIKICSCCFLDKQLYSNNLSIIATISSLIKLELLPPCFSCNNNFNQSQSSLGSEDRIIVFEMPEAMIAGLSSNLVIDSCLMLGLPVLLAS